MNKFITVVYYSNDRVDVFHVTNATKGKLQQYFNRYDIRVIKNITIELESSLGKKFKTIFTESDIKDFLDEWEIDF